MSILVVTVCLWLLFFCFYNSSLFLQNGLVLILQLALQSNSTPSLEAARVLYLDKIMYVPVSLLLCSFPTVNPSELASGRLLNLGGAPGHLSFEMSCSFTVQVLAQLDLLRNFAFLHSVTAHRLCPGTRRTSVLRLKALSDVSLSQMVTLRSCWLQADCGLLVFAPRFPSLSRCWRSVIY